MDKDLQNRVAIITGAARGIGAATAKLLAQHGATVVIADVSFNSAEAKAKELINEGLDAIPVAVNVTNEESVNKMVDDVIKRYGKIDILVNNAGIADSTPIPDMTLEGWNRVIDVDLTGTQICTKAVIKYMIEKHYGKIVNLGSMAAEQGGLTTSPSYAAAKAGVITLAKSYARYGAKYGVTANAVCPGFIATDMTKDLGQDPNTVPLGRAGSPEDVANAIYFLASPLSDYITGTTIDVNGGLFMG